MIAVDSSAIVSIIKGEKERARFSELLAASRCVVGAPSVLEVKMVLSSVIPPSVVDLMVADLVGDVGIKVLDFTPEMADAATAAFRAFGKGRGHPAQLNFGDCMAYAVAKVHGAPLLYKGEDFSLTDIVSALA